jgi:hypothetical protein
MPSRPDTFNLAGHLMLIVLLLLLTQKLRRWPVMYAVLTWPGTLAHECLHYLAGLLTGARPVSLTIMPRKENNGRWVLGEVAFARLRWWNSVPVGLAPLALFPAAGWIAWQSSVLPVLDWSGAGLKQLAVLCLMAAWPSRQDWDHAKNGLLTIGLLLIVFFGVFYLIDAQTLLGTMNQLLQNLTRH